MPREGKGISSIPEILLISLINLPNDFTSNRCLCQLWLRFTAIGTCILVFEILPKSFQRDQSKFTFK